MLIVAQNKFYSLNFYVLTCPNCTTINIIDKTTFSMLFYESCKSCLYLPCIISLLLSFEVAKLDGHAINLCCILNGASSEYQTNIGAKGETIFHVLPYVILCHLRHLSQSLTLEWMHHHLL